MIAFLDLYKKYKGKVRASASANNRDYLAKLIESAVNESFSGVSVGVTDSMRVSTIHRCVSVIADITATAPISIQDKETFIRRGAKDALLTLLNHQANKHVRAFDLRRVMDLHRQFYGNGYARIVWGVMGDPIALFFMDSRRVAVRQQDSGELEYHFTRHDGSQLILKQKEVLHVKSISYDGIVGQSILGNARNQIGLSISSEKHAATIYKNGAHTGSVLSHPERLSPESRVSLTESVAEFRDPTQKNKVLILQDDMKYTSIGMTQQDAEFVLSRKLGIVELCQFFGVPPHIAGYTENQTSSGQSVEQQTIAFVNFTINGLFSAWEAAIEQSFFQDNNDEKVNLDDAKLLRGDLIARWAAYEKARILGVFSANNILTKESEPSREDGDTLWGQPNLAKGNENESKDTTQNQT